MKEKRKYFEYRSEGYYLRFPNDEVISERNWIKLLRLIEEFKKEQAGDELSK